MHSMEKYNFSLGLGLFIGLLRHCIREIKLRPQFFIFYYKHLRSGTAKEEEHPKRKSGFIALLSRKVSSEKNVQPKWNWSWHVARQTDGKWTKRVMEWKLPALETAGALTDECLRRDRHQHNI